MDAQEKRSQDAIIPVGEAPISAFGGGVVADLREQVPRAVKAWLPRTPSAHTHWAYESYRDQFLVYASVDAEAWEHLAKVRPEHVARFSRA